MRAGSIDAARIAECIGAWELRWRVPEGLSECGRFIRRRGRVPGGYGRAYRKGAAFAGGLDLGKRLRDLGLWTLAVGAA